MFSNVNVMSIFYTQNDLKNYLTNLSKDNLSVGFVPTMGALHNGHLSLIRQALNENTIVVMSIFVNPTQFNNANDLQKYPRTLEADVALIQSLSKDVIVYAPSVQDIYEKDVVAAKFEYDGLENQMEGVNRPGHFDGVGTIVKKLFEIVEPTRAYFGEKDFQQLQIIRKMVEKNNMLVQIVGVPIFRQDDGLAMSSRNALLSEESKKYATALYAILKKAQDLFTTLSIQEVKGFVEAEILKYPKFTLEYFEIADENTLQTAIDKKEGEKYRGFIVAHLDGVRLIDNIAFN